MSFETPDDRRYLDTHEWVKVTNGTATIGITDFAQDELGDVVFVELPSVGETISQNNEFGVIESIKAVSDLYAPISGEVTGVNDSLNDRPEVVNDDPYDTGWMLEVGLADPDEIDSLLTADEYADQIA